MELDLTQVRAFVEVAEQRHFGRAAARLFLTQQALSKRIQRLEHTLGERLLVRGSGGVELTEAGQRLLPHARALLVAADATAKVARTGSWPLRLDVWGQVQAPLRIVGRLLDQDPELAVELSMRRSLGAALEALGRDELDACFGRVHDLDHPWPGGLAHRPVVLERLAVAVSADHPLSDASLLRPADLPGSDTMLSVVAGLARGGPASAPRAAAPARDRDRPHGGVARLPRRARLVARARPRRTAPPPVGRP